LGAWRSAARGRGAAEVGRAGRASESFWQQDFRFQKISTGTCAARNSLPITSEGACEAAANALKLSFQPAVVQLTESTGRPEGCYYFDDVKEKKQTLWLSTSALNKGNGAETSTETMGELRQPICMSVVEAAAAIVAGDGTTSTTLASIAPSSLVSLVWAGCFVESRPGADLGGSHVSASKTATCAYECELYSHMALHNTSGCYCLESMPSMPHFKRVSHMLCDPRCEGEAGLDPPRLCGGPASYAIYSLRPRSSPENVHVTDLFKTQGVVMADG